MTVTDDLKIVFAPPAFGKTTWLKKLNGANKNYQGFVDADDVLKLTMSADFHKPLLSCMSAYLEHKSWNQWHIDCFSAVLDTQVKLDLGPVLCGFMVGDQYDAVLKNTMKFITASPPSAGALKISPAEITIVTPRDEEARIKHVTRYVERENERGNTDANEKYPSDCLTNYTKLKKEYDQIQEVHELDDLL